MSKKTDSEFIIGCFFGAIAGLIIMAVFLVNMNMVVWSIGEEVVNVPKFGAALCGGMDLEYNSHTNDGILKINCIDKDKYTKSLIDGVVSVTKRN